MRLFCFSSIFPRVTTVIDWFAFIGLSFYHFVMIFSLESTFCFATLPQNTLLLIHDSIGDGMSYNFNVSIEKIDFTKVFWQRCISRVPGEEKELILHLFCWHRLSEGAVSGVCSKPWEWGRWWCALCDVTEGAFPELTAETKAPALWSSASSRQEGGTVKHTQRARVWVQYFLSVMNQAIINRLNVKLQLCYEKKGESFPRRSLESSHTAGFHETWSNVLSSFSTGGSFSKLGRGNRTEPSSPLFVPLQYCWQNRPVAYFPAV